MERRDFLKFSLFGVATALTQCVPEYTGGSHAPTPEEVCVKNGRTFYGTQVVPVRRGDNGEVETTTDVICLDANGDPMAFDLQTK